MDQQSDIKQLLYKRTYLSNRESGRWFPSIRKEKMEGLGVFHHVLQDPKSTSNVADIPIESQYSLLFGLLESLDFGAESCDGRVNDKVMRLDCGTAVPRMATVEMCLIAILGQSRNSSCTSILMVAGCIICVLGTIIFPDGLRCAGYSPSDR